MKSDCKFIFAESQGGFDDHIRKSIRGYNFLIQDIVDISDYFVEENTNVYDIGCSTGNLLNLYRHKEHVNYVGIDYEESFEHDHKKIQQLNKNISFIQKNICDVFLENASFITCIFTLQFIPYVMKQSILNKIYKSMNTNSCFVLAEKINYRNSFLNDAQKSIYYDFKTNNFDYKEIFEKEKKLRGMMRLNTDKQLRSMLADAGFKHIETFWQNHNFKAYISLR